MLATGLVELSWDRPMHQIGHHPTALWTFSLFPVQTLFALVPIQNLQSNLPCERRDLKEKQVKQHNQRVDNGAAECRVEEEKVQLEKTHLSGRGGLSDVKQLPRQE